MRQAVIDIGTISTLLLVAETGDANDIKVITQKFSITRLGENVSESGTLKHEAMERTLNCLREYKSFLDKEKVTNVHVLGTHALRIARNRDEFRNLVNSRIGWKLNVITAEEEAKYSFIGAIDTENNTVNLVVDIGGGSTEIIYGTIDKFDFTSLSIGVFYFAEKCRNKESLGESEITEMLSEVTANLNTIDFINDIDKNIKLFGVGGTITTLAAIIEKMTVYDPDVINGYEISFVKLKQIFSELNAMTCEERRQLPGIEKGREDVILFGMLICCAIMEKYSIEKVIASDRELRYGYLKWLQTIR